MVADSLASHDSAFANMACVRAPVLGSLSRRHGELECLYLCTLNVEIFTMMMSFKFKRRMPEIMRFRGMNHRYLSSYFVF